MTGIATGRRLPPGVYRYEDVAIGDQLATGSCTVTAEMIDRFADLSGDRFEIHMDEVAAVKRGFQARVAHGLLVLSLVDGLKNQADATFDAIASLGWTWNFRAPVFAGDTISATLLVIGMRETKNPERGILTIAFSVTNQKGETVQDGENRLMVFRR
jgi:3-hydroxybutyryl-CoA dehydratase